MRASGAARYQRLCRQSLATLQGINGLEDIFLAGLLQDIAVLAIDRVNADFYKELPATATHAQLCEHEKQRLGVDHAAVGAWLLRLWKLPEALCRTIEDSHIPDRIEASSPVGIATRCVALGGECVDVLLAHEAPTSLEKLATDARSWLGIDADALHQAMSLIVAEIPEIERLFDTTLLSADKANGILETARELLTLRNLQALEQVSSLQETAEHLEARTVALEDKHRRDALTGVYTRGYLDQVLEQEFQASVKGGWPLSVVFVDLDRFKQVNDTYGHPAGERCSSPPRS